MQSIHYHLTAFPSFSQGYHCLQGLGVVCNHPAGFEKDEFIVEFFGEVLFSALFVNINFILSSESCLRHIS